MLRSFKSLKVEHISCSLEKTVFHEPLKIVISMLAWLICWDTHCKGLTTFIQGTVHDMERCTVYSFVSRAFIEKKTRH